MVFSMVGEFGGKKRVKNDVTMKSHIVDIILIEDRKIHNGYVTLKTASLCNKFKKMRKNDTRCLPI